jgi:glycosyltransferase involved in cell wall biosynthesis
MKILHINTFDIQGGAARAAYRLHQSLIHAGVRSQMLVQTKTIDDPNVIGPERKIQKGIGCIRPVLDQLPNYLYPQKKKTPFHAAWLPFSSVLKQIKEIDPDVVHLHWIAGGFFRIEQIARIKKPIVWSLHDMWAFTGGCHIDGGCGRYRQQCGACPVLGSSNEKDLSRRVFTRKQRHFLKIHHLTINGLSRWLANCAKNSSLLKDQNVVNLPNPIDTNVYKPLPKEQAKNIIGLSLNKKHILFGAINATGDYNKGFSELTQVFHNLGNAKNIELAIFGSSEPANSPKFSIPTRYLGRLQDDISLRIIYSAADVMVVPSKQEAFGQTALEAMACGTPVVAFGVTGLLDIVEHLENGYLAKPYDTEDLACGIEYCLNIADSKKLGDNARRKVENNFDANLVANRYISLYISILKGEK